MPWSESYDFIEQINSVWNVKSFAICFRKTALFKSRDVFFHQFASTSSLNEFIDIFYAAVFQ